MRKDKYNSRLFVVVAAFLLTSLNVRAQGVSSFVESGGAQHFVFVDANQHVQQILYDGGSPQGI